MPTQGHPPARVQGGGAGWRCRVTVLGAGDGVGGRVAVAVVYRHRVVERQQQQRGEQRGARHAQSDLRSCVLPLGRAAAAPAAARGALLLAELLREEREEVSGRW